ncbi:MAG: hypothetical protein KF865_08735 [Bdellovibrionaceae bacterium]|nr:hypothetical protein [Pseudobdellovibrionaceae bacterium]
MRSVHMFALLIVVLTLSFFQNCSNVKLVRDPVEEQTEYASLFGELRPALAVRNTGCIMCHAQIHGDLISDFGFGSPFFMGLDRVANHPEQPHYSPFRSKHFKHGGTTWEDSSVMGDIYVPDTMLSDARLIGAHNDARTGNTPVAEISLTDFLASSFFDPVTEKIVRMIPFTRSDDINVPGLRGLFKSRKEIWIDAPTEDEIRSLTRKPSVVNVISELGALVYRATPNDVLQGIVVRQSQVSRRLFLTNENVLKCRGDIIVDGVLLLRDLVLDTDRGGCRLYVSGTVFIQGGVTYLNGDRNDENLQITSARAIIIGMRSLSTRMTQDASFEAVGGIRQGWTDGQELAFNNRIIQDRDSVDGLVNDAGPFQVVRTIDYSGNEARAGEIVGVIDDYDDKFLAPVRPGVALPDLSKCASTPEEGKARSPRAPCLHPEWAEGFRRKTVEFHHILLNAPKVHSRYYGAFQGVVIAEDALFAVDNFVFRSDPVMNRVPLLPLVQDRIFHVSDR